MAKLPTYDQKDDIPEGFQEYYVERDDGKWGPDVEGFVDGTKFAEFRENNRRLNAQVKELKEQVARIETLEQELAEAKERAEKNTDPNKSSALEEQVTQLRQQLATLEQTHKAERERMQAQEQEKEHRLNMSLLERDLTDAGIKAGIRKEALPDFVMRGKSIFQYVDGRPIAMEGEAERYSKKTPSEKLTIESWIQEELPEAAPHYWPPSQGTDANNGGRSGGRVVDASDPLAFGRNLEDIASGKVSVQ